MGEKKPTVIADGDRDDVKTSLLSGASTMEKFQWAFPLPSATGNDRDQAMEGFKSFLAGVTRLSRVAERLPKDEAVVYAVSVTEELEHRWADIIRFLSSL